MNDNTANQLLSGAPADAVKLSMATPDISPITKLALQMSMQQSANAVNSSLGINSNSSGIQPDFSTPSTSGASATLRGYPVTQPYGARSGVEVFSHGINTGVDIGVPKNTPVFLPSGKWKVLSAFNGARTGYVGDNENQGYGNSVYVQNVDTGEKLRFSHLNSVNVPSSILSGGQAIGLSGATGNVTGPHLDVEYHNSNGQLGDFLQTNYAKEVGL